MWIFIGFCVFVVDPVGTITGVVNVNRMFYPTHDCEVLGNVVECHRRISETFSLPHAIDIIHTLLQLAMIEYTAVAAVFIHSSKLAREMPAL